jgi:RNA polymerase sigma-70 factor (ECF subfamily)
MMSKTVPGLQSTSAPGIDESALLDATFRDHAPALRGWLTGLTRDPATADDLVGECFLRLAKEIDAGRAPLDPAAWLHRVGRNLVISRARRSTVATRAMPGLLERGVAPSPEDAVIARERDDLLIEALASLAGDDRRIVMLAAQGYRPEEIARIVGCSGPALRTRLCRARGRLRSHPALIGMTA